MAERKDQQGKNVQGPGGDLSRQTSKNELEHELNSSDRQPDQQTGSSRQSDAGDASGGKGRKKQGGSGQGAKG